MFKLDETKTEEQVKLPYPQPAPRISAHVPWPPTFGHAADYEEGLALATKANRSLKRKVKCQMRKRRITKRAKRNFYLSDSVCLLIATFILKIESVINMEAKKEGVSLVTKNIEYVGMMAMAEGIGSVEPNSAKNLAAAKDSEKAVAQMMNVISFIKGIAPSETQQWPSNNKGLHIPR